MRKIVLYFLLLYLQIPINSCEQIAQGKPYYSYNLDSLNALGLQNIQKKINQNFVQSLIAKKPGLLYELDSSLMRLGNKYQNPLIDYWRGYLQYYLAIYYLDSGEDHLSEKTINEGIKHLETIKKKNSEDLALLALLQSFSIQFKMGMEAGAISGLVKKNIKRALMLDSENLRAHFVGGSIDYYTPKQFGGGQNAESYLLKAVELPSQKIKNDYLPSWGKEEAYELLIKMYIQEKDFDKAKKYFRIGIEEFPKSYLINQLAQKLIGK